MVLGAVLCNLKLKRIKSNNLKLDNRYMNFFVVFLCFLDAIYGYPQSFIRQATSGSNNLSNTKKLTTVHPKTDNERKNSMSLSNEVQRPLQIFPMSFDEYLALFVP